MGRGIFGIDFGSVAFAIKKTTNKDAIGSYFRLHERNFQHIYYEDIEKLFLHSNNNEAYKYDFAQYRGDEGITEIPKQGTAKGLKLFYPNIPQTNFSKIPGSPIAYWVSDEMVKVFKSKNISNYSTLFQGIITGNNGLYVREWFEIDNRDSQKELVEISEFDPKNGKWVPYNKGGNTRKWYGNQQKLVNFEERGRNFTRGKHQFSNFFFKPCFSWSYISSGDIDTRYFEKGFIWDVHGSSAFPHESDDIFYFQSIIGSRVGSTILKILNPTISFQVENIAAVPVIYPSDDLKAEVISIAKSLIHISKKDWNNYETSWDFEKSPLFNSSISLSKAYEAWFKQVSDDFFQLHANEEELNRIFIDIYGLQEELTPEVALKDITILQEELDRNALEALEPVFREQGAVAISLPINKTEVISQFLSYGIGLFFGRYRLDKPGLNIAHPNPTEVELSKYQYNGHIIEIDDDGIVPLMGEDCAFPDDALVRTKDLVHAVWGEDSLTENINFIHDALGMDLHKWLTEKFWGYHTSMYQKKPVYWLFSSNVKKPQNAAFKVLVYMHRMDKYTVQKIQRNYLHPHQEYIKREIEKLSDNEENLRKQEIKRLEQLRNHELECRDYNEVLKELANQQIEFDLDEGVSVNYEKFEGAVAKI